MARPGDFAVGVDFGTSTSLVAEREAWDLAEVLPLGRGATEKWFPSLAAIHNGKLVVGEDADLPEPEPVIRSIKRAITENRSTVRVTTPGGARDFRADDVIFAVLDEIAQRSKDAGLPLENEETLRLGCPAARLRGTANSDGASSALLWLQVYRRRTRRLSTSRWPPASRG